VAIHVDGILELESIPILENICEQHWQRGKKVQLDLKGLIHVSREGNNFLQNIQNKVTFVNPPSFTTKRS